MSNVSSVVVGVIGVAAGVVIGAFGPFSSRAVEPVTAPASGLELIAPRDAAFTPPTSVDATASANVESRLAHLASLVAELDRKLTTLLERAPERTPVPGAAIDEDALARALARVETHKRDAMSDDELIAEAKRLLNTEKNSVAAKEVIDALLQRQIEPAKRAGIMIDLGIAQRQTGDLEGSDRALRDAMQSADTGSEAQAWAAYQLVWTSKARGKNQDALALADSIARCPGAGESLLVHGRWVAASLAHDLGDVARARADYAAILATCGDEPGYAGIVKDVKSRLAALQ